MNWTEVGKVTSVTDPSKIYVIKVNDKGEHGCDCPAWKFSHQRDEEGHRTCKHIKAFLEDSSAPLRETPKEREFSIIHFKRAKLFQREDELIDSILNAKTEEEKKKFKASLEVVQQQIELNEKGFGITKKGKAKSVRKVINSAPF